MITLCVILRENNNTFRLYTTYLEILILSQGSTHNENIHVNNNKIITVAIVLEDIILIMKVGKMRFKSHFKHIYIG